MAHRTSVYRQERLALKCLQRRRFAMATDYLLGVMDTHQRIDSRTLNYFYWELIAAKQFKEAERLIKRRLIKEPESAKLHYALGHCYMEQGENREALKPLKKSLSLSPGDPIIHDALFFAYWNGSVLNTSSYLRLALSHLRKSRVLYPDAGVYWGNVCLVETKQQNWPAVRTILRHLETSNATVYYHLSRELLSFGPRFHWVKLLYLKAKRWGFMNPHEVDTLRTLLGDINRYPLLKKLYRIQPSCHGKMTRWWRRYIYSCSWNYLLQQCRNRRPKPMGLILQYSRHPEYPFGEPHHTKRVTPRGIDFAQYEPWVGTSLECLIFGRFLINAGTVIGVGFLITYFHRFTWLDTLYQWLYPTERRGLKQVNQ